MTGFTCTHCKTTLSSKPALNLHQKTAKYCLKLRANIPAAHIECEYCGKTFSRPSSLSKHHEKCSVRDVSLVRAEIADLKIKLKISTKKANAAAKKARVDHSLLIDSKDAEIAKLKEDITKLTSEKDVSHGRILELKDAKPQTVIGTAYINPKLANVPTANIRPLTIETVREDIHKYDYTEFLRGLPGLTKFIEDIIVEPTGDLLSFDGTVSSDSQYARNYVCTDVARNKFHRLVESKDWTSDGGATFIHKILDELRDISNDHFSALAAEELAAVSDEFQRNHIDATKSVVKPVFFGITGTSTGSDRAKLFKALRTTIKDAAAI